MRREHGETASPTCTNMSAWLSEGGRMTDDFHYSSRSCAGSEWSECYFYKHENSNSRTVPVLKQGRRKTFHGSFPVILACYPVAGSQRLYLLIKCPPPEEAFPSSVPAAGKHFTFPATISRPPLQVPSNVLTPAHTRSGIQD